MYTKLKLKIKNIVFYNIKDNNMYNIRQYLVFNYNVVMNMCFIITHYIDSERL